MPSEYTWNRRGALPPGNATKSTYDVTAYGAKPNDPTNDFAQAYYNTVAAWTQNNKEGAYPLFDSVNVEGSIEVPTGQYYTSMPLCQPSGGQFIGSGPLQTLITPGKGDGTTSLVSTFGGPVVYGASPYTPSQLPAPASFPSFTSPLVGGVGQSLVLQHSSPNATLSCFRLHDAYPWGAWMGNTHTLTDFGLEFWVSVNETPSANMFLGIIGSRGPKVWFSRGAGNEADVAFGVYLVSDGINLFLKAYLTTNPAFNGPVAFVQSGTIHTITSSAISANTPVHVELDYNGVFFDFYVNGVNQGHLSASGPIIRAPWEGTGIGAQGPEFLDVPPYTGTDGIAGSIDSIRLSNVHRHTGTGSFTPPVAKYTWDANTMALYNWDQGVKTVQPKKPDGSNNGPLLTLPFLLGQTVSGTALSGFAAPALTSAPTTHYIRLYGSAVSGHNLYKDFSIGGWFSCSGLIVSNALRNKIDRVWTAQTTHFGIKIDTAVSFFNEIEDVWTFWSCGTGIALFGDGHRGQTLGCGIGLHIMAGGSMDIESDQPQYNSYIGALFSGGSGIVSDIYMKQYTYDSEVWTFNRQVAVGVNLGSMGSFVSTNNSWSATGSATAPFKYFGVPPGGTATHINDQFLANTAGSQGAGAPPCSMIAYDFGVPTDTIQVINCPNQDFNLPALPKSNVQGWINFTSGKGGTNLQSISVSDVQANNLAGTFTIQHGYTAAHVLFPVPEPDANYQLQITPLDYVGSAPAAGAETIVFPVSRRQTGFTARIKTDPGGTCTATYAWQLNRMQPPPLYFSYLPTSPSSFANPLAAFPADSAFAVGVTIVPASGNVFVYDLTKPLQAVVTAGPIAGANSWATDISANGVQYRNALGTSVVDYGARVSPTGQLVNILSPGAHNLALYNQGGVGQSYIDGPGTATQFGPQSAGTQPATVYVGQFFNGTSTLSTATLRNLKIDPQVRQVFSNDNDVGPGEMPESAFVGDDWTLGYANTAAGGGFASQIAQARYGSKYYHLAAVPSARFDVPTNVNNNILEFIWKPWQGIPSNAASLQNLCLLLGWYDIVNGSTAVNIWAKYQLLLNGSPATNTWFPPTSTSSPVDQHGFAEWVPPNAGSSTVVINGHTFTISFNTSQLQTINDAITAINAHAPTAALVTPSAQIQGDGSYALYLKSVAAGTAGNGITVSTNGANGSFCYGDVGGGFGGAGSAVLTFNGTDTTFTIGGVTFIQNFITNAATTVNAAVAQVNANPTTSALVTASNVANQMLITANANGRTGNAIATTGVAVNTPQGSAWVTEPPIHHMTGGANGAIQNGIPNIVLCTVPPIGTGAGVTAPMITELNSLNALIGAFVGAGVTIANVNTTLRDPAHHDNLLPAYDTGSGFLNNAGHTALVGLLGPLLP